MWEQAEMRDRNRQQALGRSRTIDAGPRKPAEDIIDLAAAMRRLGGDAKLLRDLVGFFLEDAPQFLKQIDSAIKARDYELLTRSAHSLKGMAASFDAVACVEAAAEVERLGRRGDLSGAADATDELARTVHEVELRLQQVA